MLCHTLHSKLIVGFDFFFFSLQGRNPSSRSVMRWFHVTPKETGNLMSIKNQSSENEIVDFSLSGGAAKERVLFPMKLQVTHRRFRWESK